MIGKEQVARLTAQFMTKQNVDEKSGIGMWRGIRRQCFWQESQSKYRLIDNAKASETSDAYNLSETMSIESPDIACKVYK